MFKCGGEKHNNNINKQYSNESILVIIMHLNKDIKEIIIKKLPKHFNNMIYHQMDMH